MFVAIIMPEGVTISLVVMEIQNTHYAGEYAESLRGAQENL